MTRSILFVDDELQILKALRRVFGGENFALHFAQSAEEALKILAQEPIDILITDMRMPQVDGIELLTQAKARYPHVVRAILSGYADEQMVFRAVAQNLSKLYLYKPWQNEALLEQINHLFALKDRLDQLRLTRSMITREDFPTQNKTYQKLMQLLQENAGIHELASVIEADLAISSRILRIANSAYFGVKTASIKQALVFFGLKHIREIVLTSTLFEAPQISGRNARYLDKLWRHASLTSQILTGLYEYLYKEKIPEQSHMAGLLHDIGRVVMLLEQPETFEKLYPHIGDRRSDCLALERELFGITHEEVGGLLLDWWDFPYALVEPVLYHHDPLREEAVSKKLLRSLNLADQLAWVPRGERIEAYLSLELVDSLDLSFDQLYRLMAQIEHPAD